MSIHPGQFRLSRIQLINWGTFDGAVDIPVSREGFLITGGSGSGKSTLIDAVTAVLLPGDRLRFNTAAQLNTQRGRGRNLVSYIRGAWRSREDHATGKVVATYLRPKATYSVVGLTYDDGLDQTHTLLAVFYLKSGHNNPGEVNRLYGIFPEDFKVLDLVPFLGSGIDKRRIKATFQQATFSENHAVFADRFRARLGIAHQEAQFLLHRAQSAKDLQSLDDLFRDYMLPEPQTFDYADTAINSFRDLEGAYEKVEDIRAQITALEPLTALDQKKTRAVKERDHAEELRRALPAVSLRIKLKVAQEAVRRCAVTIDEATSQLASASQARERAATRERMAQDAVDATLGSRHRELELRKAAAVGELERATARRTQLVEAVTGINGEEPQDAEAFQRISGDARVMVEEYPEAKEELNEESQNAVVARTRAEDISRDLDRELSALSRGTSNIDSRLLEIREKLCRDLALNTRDLPFAGELMDVTDPEWEAVIQRQLGSLAATLLVPGSLLPRVREWINAHHLGARLRVNAVPLDQEYTSPRMAANALPRKVQVIDSPFQSWLNFELASKHNFRCVSIPAELDQLTPRDRGITLQGLIQHAQAKGDPTVRLEKNDARTLGDRSTYRLGSTNHEKIELLREQVHQAGIRIEAARNRQRQAGARRDELDREFRAAQLILDTTWAAVDTDSAQAAVTELDRAIAELSRTPEAEELSRALAAAKTHRISVEAEWSQLNGAKAVAENEHHHALAEYERLQKQPMPKVSADINAELEKRLAEATRRIHRGNVDERTAALRDELDETIRRNETSINTLNNQITRTLTQYLETWRSEQADLMPHPDYIGEALNRLGALRGERLGEFTERFLRLINEMSTRNLVAIANTLRNARREIEERIEPINESLARSEFNRERYLHIEVRDRRGEVVVEFQRDLDEAISGGLGMDDEKQAFARYGVIARIIGRLGSQDSADIRWKNLVLDTRRHVSFIGLERDAQGQTVNTYVDSSSLSGGQAQKLVFFCLAAALRYQLAEPGAQYPTYASVILDEAFDRADPTFTRQTMDVFTSFGFHMVLATPLKLIRTLSPYVGATLLVDYQEKPDANGEIRGLSGLSRIDRV
ncbi:Chromosome partition protein Smc [Corynebacterium occultum]|uniref:Chromosome partition protein Smc n=1 Tax=Corynebacterium occultum TaxID=2675219 RepID=A0A6B8VSL5_9CORY|nr:ATP-binding protein [Corynebacterium occultum]QGU06059.1 Chromosome partition protein Smc [Corynebacterium occultum]